MIVALSDTHCRQQPRLTSHLRSTIRDADRLLHCGDFTTAAVYSYFQGLASGLVAVTGNRDQGPLREKLPAETTTEWKGLTFLLVHGHRHDRTAMSMLARQEEADVVVTGHSHRPVIEELGERLLVNPGSHADPRGNQPAYATFEREGEGHRVTLKTPDGERLETRTLQG
ncbi:MAG: metallophosphoesterase [Halovenus sp.]